ncbi:MAG TPA: hypothetical protein VKZ49_17330 [Polyangiaceae bacterium]|nr:hypothetical protein [Polyangiaceae bacterium]
MSNEPRQPAEEAETAVAEATPAPAPAKGKPARKQSAAATPAKRGARSAREEEDELEDEDDEEWDEDDEDEDDEDDEDEDDEDDEDEDDEVEDRARGRRAAAARSRRAAPRRPASEKKIVLDERKIDTPKLQTLGMLSVVVFASLSMWGAARFACNAHPPETRKPRVPTQQELSGEPKDAAFEIGQRWTSYDFAGALALSSGALAEAIKADQAKCQANAGSCAEKKAALVDAPLTTAALLARTPTTATVRVTQHGGLLGKQDYIVELVKEGNAWKGLTKQPYVAPSAAPPAAPPTEASESGETQASPPQAPSPQAPAAPSPQAPAAPSPAAPPPPSP